MFQIKNEAQRATVYLYGTIGSDFWDMDSSNTAKNFAATLDELSPKPLDIRIDSCGGDVYEGFGIASAIQRYEGETTAYVDGIAASAASYIAVMADKVVMNDFAQLMIHDAWTYTSGNAAELLVAAERLEAVDATIAGIIAARSGMDVEDVRAAMDAETWYDATAAVEAGLADEIVETKQRVAACIDQTILERYKHAPKAAIEALASPKAEEPEDAEGKSHAANTMQRNEGCRLLVLGNRVYRTKE